MLPVRTFGDGGKIYRPIVIGRHFYTRRFLRRHGPKPSIDLCTKNAFDPLIRLCRRFDFAGEAMHEKSFDRSVRLCPPDVRRGSASPFHLDSNEGLRPWFGLSPKNGSRPEAGPGASPK